MRRRLPDIGNLEINEIFHGDTRMIRRTITNAILLSLLPFLPIASLRAADSKGNDLLQMVVELLGEKDKDFR